MRAKLSIPSLIVIAVLAMGAKRCDQEKEGKAKMKAKQQQNAMSGQATDLRLKAPPEKQDDAKSMKGDEESSSDKAENSDRE